MGPGLHLETQEEIERIQNAGNDPHVTGNDPKNAENDPENVEHVPNKRKTREKLKSVWWNHFAQGDVQADGSYDATCNYCGTVIKMGCQRGTSTMKNHIKKACKKVPWNLRHKPDAIQKLLQAGKDSGMVSLEVSFLFCSVSYTY